MEHTVVALKHLVDDWSRYFVVDVELLTANTEDKVEYEGLQWVVCLAVGVFEF